MQIVIEIVRQRRRTGSGTESEQAALAERPLLRVIEGARRLGCAILALPRVRGRGGPGPREPLARGRIVGRYMAVRRVNDDGGSNLSVDYCVCRALVQPDTIVTSDRATPGLL